MQNPTWYNNQVHGCYNIAVQSCHFIIAWQHVLSWMNVAVDLSWWFQQRCSNLFVHQAMNSLFQHAWTSLPTTMFKLASSTMFKLASSTMFKLTSSTVFKSVNRQKQAVPFYVCKLAILKLYIICKVSETSWNRCCKNNSVTYGIFMYSIYEITIEEIFIRYYEKTMQRNSDANKGFPDHSKDQN